MRTLFITNTTFPVTNSSSDLDASVNEFVSNSISPEIFFQSLPILQNFFFCVLVEDINDNIIESTEDVVFYFMTQNENDKFETFNSTSINTTLQIRDNDGAFYTELLTA